MNRWMDEQADIHIHIYTATAIYINRRIDIYTNISIYRRIYRHRTCEYINPSIHIWISGTLSQSPANA